MGRVVLVTGVARHLGGRLARALQDDPTVDRLLFIVALVAIIIDGGAPRWFCVAVLARELIVGVSIAIATVFFAFYVFVAGSEQCRIEWWRLWRWRWWIGLWLGLERRFGRFSGLS